MVCSKAKAVDRAVEFRIRPESECRCANALSASPHASSDLEVDRNGRPGGKRLRESVPTVAPHADGADGESIEDPTSGTLSGRRPSVRSPLSPPTSRRWLSHARSVGRLSSTRKRSMPSHQQPKKASRPRSRYEIMTFLGNCELFSRKVFLFSRSFSVGCTVPFTSVTLETSVCSPGVAPFQA